MPFISFIIPVKNRFDFLNQTIESLLQLRDTDWEAIIVDDHSDENCFNKIQLIADKDNRINLYKRTGNKGGASICRNQGLEYANADYVVFLDSDDLIGANFIETRKDAIKNYPNKEMWIFPVQVFFNAPGDSKLLWNIFNENDDIDRFLNTDNVWHTTSPVWKKNAVQKIGGFHPDLTCWQDWEIHLRALANQLKYHKITQTPDIFYRRHESDAISKHNISEKNLIGRFMAVKSVFYVFKEKQMLNTKRNYLFAKLLINIYINWIKNNPSMAKEIISFVKNESLISKFELNLWLSRLKNNNIIGKLIDKYIYQKYNDHFLDTKTSYLNVKF
jgi:glycosyltransferase involved in cell wall biosynthesis